MVLSRGYTDVFPKREMWQEIAKELNGEFHIRLSSDNSYEMHLIEIPHENRKIEISVSDSKPLKFYILFELHQEFELYISWEDLVGKIMKKFGSKDVLVGSEEFDKHYLIKSNKPHAVKDLITREIQNAFLKYNIYSLSFQAVPKTNNAELIAVIQRTPGNKEMILELINAFKLLTDHLKQERIVR